MSRPALRRAPAAIPARVERLLHKTFGIARLRPGQQEVIASVLSGRDTLALMPTGSGKSLCYQLPALHLHGTTVVVSPLIALMKDQVDKLHALGLDATQINSSLTGGEQDEALARIRAGHSGVVFATPERLATDEFRAALGEQTVKLFVVDEAHCVSQWGHDFRPAFLELADAIAALGRPQILALTATATEAVVDDIVRQLKMKNARIVNAGIYRENLEYRVIQVGGREEKLGHLAAQVEKARGSGIVYTATIKAAQEVYDHLKARRVPVALYHGRLKARERNASQDAFMYDRVRVMVATNAFGMGVDKRDIRFIVHYQMPATLEAYYQEAGRAGRDGKAAQCTLLYDFNDRRTQQFFLLNRYPGAAEIETVYRATQDQTAEAPLTTNKQRVAMKLLRDAGYVSSRARRRATAQDQTVDARTFERLAAEYREKTDGDRAKLERMIAYAQSAQCRWKFLLDYFGDESGFERCGRCDNCLSPPVAVVQVEEEVPALEIRTAAFEQGQPVRVRRYGRGSVIAASAEEVVVAFPDGATKKFMPKYVRAAVPG